MFHADPNTRHARRYAAAVHPSNEADGPPPFTAASLTSVYRVTKYDPADRDECGCYTGDEPSTSDHGPVEAAYLDAVAAFADASGVERLAIREPEVAGFVGFGLEPPRDDNGLAGLFPADLAGFHDGALVTIPVAQRLVRAMLRDNGAWCRLEEPGAFAVHVGYDQYLYISSGEPCDDALEQVRSLGLFAERLDASPCAPDPDAVLVDRPADDDFWALVRRMLHESPLLLDERFLGNRSRWHLLTTENVDAVRSAIGPRARLTVWPNLLTDAESMLASLPEDDSALLLWQEADGRIASAPVEDADEARSVLAGHPDARTAALTGDVDQYDPLLSAVLPDDDGVVRARWQSDLTPTDRRWARMRDLVRGQVVTGTVTSIADHFVTYVDIGDVTAQINVPQLTSRRIDHPSEVVTVGQVVTAVVLGVDFSRELVSLSLTALESGHPPAAAAG